jgi:hypothetical protein
MYQMMAAFQKSQKEAELNDSESKVESLEETDIAKMEGKETTHVSEEEVNASMRVITNSIDRLCRKMC